MTAILREAGDTTTTVPSAQLRAGFTTFGQTSVAPGRGGRVTAHLPCMAGTEHVLAPWGRVAGNQQWGVEAMAAPSSTAVKGGWGPGPPSRGGGPPDRPGHYSDGTMTAIAMATQEPPSTVASRRSMSLHNNSTRCSESFPGDGADRRRPGSCVFGQGDFKPGPSDGVGHTAWCVAHFIGSRPRYGDSRNLMAGGHGVSLMCPATAADLRYLKQLAAAAETNGFEAVLTPPDCGARMPG